MIAKMTTNPEFFPSARKVKAYFKHAEEEKPFFKDSNAVLLISVGQPIHEGEKLRATLETINNNFKECDICVADTLQKYNYENYNEQKGDVEDFAAQRGAEWIERNKNFIQFLTIPHKIWRWDDFLEVPIFQQAREVLLDVYYNDESFKKDIDFTIEEYIFRCKKRNPETNVEQIYENSLEYLIEECTVYYMLWGKMKEHQYRYIIYPNVISKALKVCYEKLALSNYPNLYKWVHIKVE